MALNINNLSVSYGQHSVLDDLTFPTIEPGEMVSLIGKNGAGKSTVLKQMTKLIKREPNVFSWQGKPLRLG